MSRKCGLCKYKLPKETLTFTLPRVAFKGKCHLKCVSCERCEKPLTAPFITCDQKHFHKKCLQCVSCKITLNNHETVIIDKLVYCRSCPPCQICKLSSVDKDLYQLQLDIATKLYYHAQCLANYRCPKCEYPIMTGREKLQLGQAIMIDKDGNIVHAHQCDKVRCTVCLKCVQISNIQDIVTASYYVETFRVHKECSSVVSLSCSNRNKKYHAPHSCIDLKRLMSNPWSPLYHHLFVIEIKQAIETLAIVHSVYRRVRKTPLSVSMKAFTLMPRDILHVLFKWIATPNGWSKINHDEVDTICTTMRCAKASTKCQVCYGAISAVCSDPKWDCLTDRCKSYRYRCQKCETPYGHDIPLEISCTPHRCLQEKCDLCAGELCYDGDSGWTKGKDKRYLCLVNQCKIYYNEKCPGCAVRMKNPLVDRKFLTSRGLTFDIFTDCTTYRCARDVCRTCNNDIIPTKQIATAVEFSINEPPLTNLKLKFLPREADYFLRVNDMCSKNTCLTLKRRNYNQMLFLNKTLNMAENVILLPKGTRYYHYELAISRQLGVMDPALLVLVQNCLTKYYSKQSFLP